MINGQVVGVEPQLRPGGAVQRDAVRSRACRVRSSSHDRTTSVPVRRAGREGEERGRVAHVRPHDRGPRLLHAVRGRPLPRQGAGNGPRPPAVAVRRADRRDGGGRRRHRHAADRVPSLLRRLPRARGAREGGGDARSVVRRATRVRHRRRVERARVRGHGPHVRRRTRAGGEAQGVRRAVQGALHR